MHDLSQQAAEAQQARENEPSVYPRSRFVDNGNAVELRPYPNAYPHIRIERGEISLFGFPPSYPIDVDTARQWGVALAEAAQIAEALRVQPDPLNIVSSLPLDSGEFRPAFYADVVSG